MAKGSAQSPSPAIRWLVVRPGLRRGRFARCGLCHRQYHGPADAGGADRRPAGLPVDGQGPEPDFRDRCPLKRHLPEASRDTRQGHYPRGIDMSAWNNALHLFEPREKPDGNRHNAALQTEGPERAEVGQAGLVGDVASAPENRSKDEHWETGRRYHPRQERPGEYQLRHRGQINIIIRPQQGDQLD